MEVRVTAAVVATMMMVIMNAVANI
jgi:hypothetical protein